MEDQKFPIGKYEKPENFAAEYLNSCIETIENFPKILKIEVQHLNKEQLDTSYRENGWTIRQVVHHCADSHMNSLMRFKLALTEGKPIIKPYFEEKWAELPDSKILAIEPALKMLEGIHERWTFLLKSMKNLDFERTFIHPEHHLEFSLMENIGIYSWHCNHHLAHITHLKQKKGWI